MMDSESITRDFKARESLYERLRTEGLFILRSSLDAEKIKLHSITSRIKGLDSVLDKSARKQFEDPLNEMSDIVGLRVVCLFISDVERIGSVIRKSFAVVGEDNKTEGGELSAGYKTIGDVDRVVNAASDAFAKYESLSNYYADVGVVRASANIADDNYVQIYVNRNFGPHSSTYLESERKRYGKFREFLKKQ